MTSKGIVINTSPWIALSICGQLNIINKLYSHVYIPELKPLILKIRDHGIWVKDDIIQGILQEAGERL